MCVYDIYIYILLWDMTYGDINQPINQTTKEEEEEEEESMTWLAKARGITMETL